MAHHGVTRCIPVVYIRSWSLDVDLVGAFWTLAAGVDEVSPAHDLRRPVQHGVDLFIALRVQFLDELLNDHDAPAKGQVASARQQLETLWQLWITDQHGVESDQEPSGGNGKGSKRPASLSSGRCSTPPP